ncbi:hypothetical protein TNCV_2988841 [Trichonephila clavipes]|nr:hypothetical protein TNCV_2988841 [Trichonephila clavipes]
MLEKVIENWTSRLDYIRASRGITKAHLWTRSPSDCPQQRGWHSQFNERKPLNTLSAVLVFLPAQSLRPETPTIPLDSIPSNNGNNRSTPVKNTQCIERDNLKVTQMINGLENSLPLNQVSYS